MCWFKLNDGNDYKRNPTNSNNNLKVCQVCWERETECPLVKLERSILKKGRFVKHDSFIFLPFINLSISLDKCHTLSVWNLIPKWCSWFNCYLPLFTKKSNKQTINPSKLIAQQPASPLSIKGIKLKPGFLILWTVQGLWVCSHHTAAPLWEDDRPIFAFPIPAKCTKKWKDTEPEYSWKGNKTNIRQRFPLCLCKHCF